MSEKVGPSIFKRAIKALTGGGEKLRVTGLWGSSKALFLWELALSQGRPILAVSPTPKEARALFDDFSFFTGSLPAPGDSATLNTPLPEPSYFPPWDVLPYDVVAPDPAVVAERLRALKDIDSGSSRVVFASVKALMQKLPPPDELFGEEVRFEIKPGADIERESLLTRLTGLGYERASMVYEPGEFSVRGGILDLFGPGMDSPARIEFIGDTVESIRSFDADTQRSISGLAGLTVLPAREADTTGASTETLTYLTSYFTEPPLIVMEEPERAVAQCEDFIARAFSAYEHVSEGKAARPELLYLTDESFKGLGFSVSLEALPVSGPGSFDYKTRSIEGLRLRDSVPANWPEEIPKTPVSIFCRNLKGLSDIHAVTVVSPTAGQAERLGEIFAEYGLASVKGAPLLAHPGPGEPPVRVTVGGLSAGFMMDVPGLMFINASEIFGEKPRHAPAPRAKVERFLTSLSELNPGDYVVHIDHGIGWYVGLKRLTLLGVEADFLELVYQGGDRLYVPVDELGKVQKYIGAEGGAARADKLGGVMWERAKSRAKKAVLEMAKELLELYAARAVAPGHAYSPDDHLYREMEASFEYEETPDQARAIDDVKSDLMRPHPMDRLVCGDVGYGKTEVAVRACFKAALDGKQAAVLVPTTLLASQHYETFSARLAAFPVRVEMLSRFTSKQHQKEIVKGIADGTVDVVIGTHRLLQKDVAFKDLGLVVIDEEHRFGVRHKERLKAMRKQVDVLTLTATPIPRTLHMSITGIRDLSIIETPPPDRQPIKTIVTRFDRATVQEAITREMARGGQIFFVHNRIDSIYAVGDVLRGIAPEARIAVAHGRMAEDALEKVMSAFISGEYDILLTTSIIESGLDIPSANTIIINRADRFGLADLYQLRGRVGRSQVRAYAYLLVPGEEALTEVAQKRLRVLSELTGLGAGFKLALHDLEIRGAGNILGSEQSGHIAAVGFELYTQMLEDAVKNLRGEVVEEAVEPALELKVSAYIPESYVPDTAHRLGIYKRLAGARSEAELADLAAELMDRYGPVPPEARRLVEVMEIKVLARRLKVAGIQLLPSEVKVTFTDKVDIPPDRLLSMLGKRKGKARYVPEYTIFFKRPEGGWEGLSSGLLELLKELT